MAKTQSFAILAAVPEMHLISAVETIAKLEDESSDEEIIKVAFGSMAFEVFRKADELRGGKAVEVLIYASHSDGDQPLHSEVSWQGLYIGHVNSRNGRYPGKAKFRPPATATDKPTWAIFWELQELKQLKTPIAIASLKALGKKSNYTSRFIPEEPSIIEYH
ncbi:MAG: hypothetical protein KME32_30780 [Mojavia pulchra JT2-VF2]|jgi:hypothetical protein|uniref:Uncharacterized protein n=1 Tax=Mojavia pulchra JT2-VF2 TaxID=287848 RepID=A0A951Q5Z4_9NOST|nr:hypothetical protein [Mojavia pulchra JT2-VF2]